MKSKCLCVFILLWVAQVASGQSRIPISVENPTAAALTNHTVRIEITAPLYWLPR